MTKSTITREQAQKIIVAADEVITALAGTNEDVHPDDSKKMCELWDDLNDRYAPPVVVRELAYIALATLGSEPVAEVLSNRPGNDTSTIDMALPVGTQLYLHAQPAPVVPDAATAIRACLSEFPESARDIVEECADIAENACRSAMLQAEPVTTANKLGNSPVIPDGSEDTKRLNWLDAQNKRLNEYYGTSYGWKFDANFQRNAMMLNDSNYPVMTVRQAIDEAIAAAPQEVKGE